MSGKNAQRTKGNVKPSSSTRAAELLHQDGGSGFIGFSGLAGNSLGYVPQVKNEEDELDGDLRMLLRKMTKKATVTKLKAIQEFTELCKTKENDVISNILSYWPRIYHKLAHDFDHRVREATQQAHHQIATKAGRNLAPHLKLIITDWLLSHFDTYAPSSTAAKIAFNQVFQGDKKKEVLSFCKMEILETLQNHILEETMDTLSDPKVVPVEEREAKFFRFISSSFHAFNYFLHIIDPVQLKKMEVSSSLEKLLHDKKFWKYVKNSSPLIRNAFYNFIGSALQTISELVGTVLPQLCPASLTHLDEQEPTVVGSMWDAALLCLLTFESSWDHVNSRKAVLPNLWKTLKNGGFGNVNVVYPNLLPFIMHIPTKVTGDGPGFYNEFFNNFLEGLHAKQNVLTSSDTKVIIRSYVECLRFLLMKRSSDSALISYLINSQLQTVLNEIFLSEEPRQMWYGMVFIELKSLLKTTTEQAKQNNENSLYSQTLEKDIWKAITSTIIRTAASTEPTLTTEPEAKPAETTAISKNGSSLKTFQRSHRNFYDSLVDFLFCVCSGSVGDLGNEKEQLNSKPNNIVAIQESFNGFLYNLLEDCITSYDTIMKTSSSTIVVKQEFAKILTVSLCKPLLVHAVNLQLRNEENEQRKMDDSSEDLLVVQTFVNTVITPLLCNEDSVENTPFIKAVAAILKILTGGDKKKFLKFLLGEFTKTEAMKMNMLAEIFKYQEDEVVVDWLKSELVQDIIVNVCSSDMIKSTNPLAILRWDILNIYSHLIEDELERLDGYFSRLLSLMSEFLKQVQAKGKEIKEMTSMLGCFSTVSSKDNAFSQLFIEVWLAIFQNVVNEEGDERFKKCVNLGLQKISKFSDDDFRTFSRMFVAQIYDWLNVVNVERMTNEICNTVQKLKVSNKTNKFDVELIDQFFKEQLEKNVKSNEKVPLHFQADLLAKLSTTCLSSLQETSQERLIFCCQQILMVEDVSIKSCLQSFIVNTEYLHNQLIESTISRSSATKTMDVFEALLDLFTGLKLLGDDLMDYCLQLCAPSEYTHLQCVDAFTTVVPYISDVSCVRAFVVKYEDELENDADVKNNILAFACNITLLTSVLRKWHSLIQCQDDVTSNDYVTTITETMDILLVWKEENIDSFLFASNLNEQDQCVIAMNARSIDLLVVAMTTCVNGLRKEHWDFMLCSLVSWLQSCQESYVFQIANTKFFINALTLFYATASIFTNGKENSQSHDSLLFATPGVSLKGDIQIPSATALSSDMTTEWEEFFLPAASTSIMSMFKAVLNTDKWNRNDDFSRVLCACCNFVPTAVIMEVCFVENSGTNKKKGGKKKSPPEEFFMKMCVVMKEGSWCFRLASFQLQSKVGEIIEEFCVDHEEDENHEELRSFPESLLEVMEESRNTTLKCLTDKGASIIEPAQDLDDDRDKTSLLTYLLSWHFMLQIFQLASLDKRAKLANYFHKTSHVNDLVTCLFCIMPMSCDREAKKKHDQVTTLSYSNLQYVGVSLLTKAMQCIPALLRHWFKNHLNRNESAQIDKFVSYSVSPELLKSEFQRLDDAFKTFDNMIVKTRPTAREVVAVYTVEEISMELVVKLAANYPLSPVTVECGKRIGVPTSLWRQWMLQLTTFLSFQNGTILDGLTLWKKNVDKRFEGLEECMICFSVIHGSNYSLPTISCKTCKKKFHPVCLYKWFNTSGKSTCPLCRNIF